MACGCGWGVREKDGLHHLYSVSLLFNADQNASISCTLKARRWALLPLLHKLN